MLDSATVTLSYKEFKHLVDEAEESKLKDKDILNLEEMLESREERKCLDNVFDNLVKAYGAKGKGKQELILESIKECCETFNISIEQLIDIQ